MSEQEYIEVELAKVFQALRDGVEGEIERQGKLTVGIRKIEDALGIREAFMFCVKVDGNSPRYMTVKILSATDRDVIPPKLVSHGAYFKLFPKEFWRFFNLAYKIRFVPR